MCSKLGHSSIRPQVPSDDLHKNRATCMYMCEYVGKHFGSLSFGDGEVINNDIREFYFAH